MPKHPLFTAATLIALGTAPATAFQPHIPLDVRAAGTPGLFEVFEQRGAGPTHIWCAAADHARRVLDAPSAQRIYVAAPLGPSESEPGRSSVSFALSAEAAGLSQSEAAARPLLSYTSIRRAGASMNLTHALQFCTDHLDVP